MVSALVSFQKWMKGTNKSQDYSNIAPWKLSHAPGQSVQRGRESTDFNAISARCPLGSLCRALDLTSSANKRESFLLSCLFWGLFFIDLQVTLLLLL